MITYHNSGLAAIGTHTTYSWTPQMMFTTLITATSVTVVAIGGWVSGIAQNFTRPAEIA